MGKHKEKKMKIEPQEAKSDEDEAMEQEEKKPPLPNPTTEKEEYEALCTFVNPISQPLANRKQAKKIYKLIRKSSKIKYHLRQGIVDVQRALRKNEKGIVILAGDITPVDIYAHIAGICEESGLPYCYTPSKHGLGLASGHRRPSIMVLIKKHDDYMDLYTEVHEMVDKIPIPR